MFRNCNPFPFSLFSPKQSPPSFLLNILWNISFCKTCQDLIFVKKICNPSFWGKFFPHKTRKSRHLPICKKSAYIHRYIHKFHIIKWTYIWLHKIVVFWKIHKLHKKSLVSKKITPPGIFFATVATNVNSENVLDKYLLPVYPSPLPFIAHISNNFLAPVTIRPELRSKGLSATNVGVNVRRAIRVHHILTWAALKTLLHDPLGPQCLLGKGSPLLCPWITWEPMMWVF